MRTPKLYDMKQRQEDRLQMWVLRFLLLPLAGLGLLVVVPSAYAQKFMADDPIWEDSDRLSIPKPQPIELSKGYDMLEKMYLTRIKPIPRAENINTLGEVPNSSWFINRIGLYPTTIEQLVRGPNRLEGPDMSIPWTITSAKFDGITPGFVIRDGRGDVYFIKLDPKGYPQLATSAEVISTKFFHAFGYNVPENYLAFFHPEQLEIGSEATIKGKDGKRRPMSQENVDAIVNNVPRRADGTIQALASLRLSGEPLGPFNFYGTRSDDPNDIFPHENLRELRGLRVFAAWLNHNDSDSANTLDIYVKEVDRSYVKHYLIDFGTTLGSGATGPHARRAGNEYYLEWKPILKSLATLGIWLRPWRRVDYPDYPAVGRFESYFFEPEKWKPDYPNPAFDSMQNEDAFWATRIVMHFTDEMVKAIVRTGQISDPQAEHYLVQTLIRRRDKIVQHYLGQINPLSDFQLVKQSGATRPVSLTFENLGILADLASAASYQYQWFRFDNERISLEPITEAQSLPSPILSLPTEPSPYLMVRIRTVSRGQENWRKKIEVYIRNGPEKSIVGIDREN